MFNKKEYQKKYRQTDKNKKYQQEYRKTEAFKNSVKKHRSTEAYKDCAKKYSSTVEHKEAQKIRVNRFKKTDKWRQHQRDRYKKDIQFRLKRILRRGIWGAIKGNQKKGSPVRDVGCTIVELKLHIENQFVEGMSWDNWSPAGWHIDHRKPLASFDLTNRDQFLKAVNYTNLQPLWAIDNFKKGQKTL